MGASIKSRSKWVLRYLLPVGAGLLIGLLILGVFGAQPGRTGQTGPVNSSAGQAGRTIPDTPLATSTSAPVTSPATIKVPARPAPPPGIGTQYLALGDSVAFGLGAPTPQEGGYAGLLYNNYLKRVQPDLTVYRNLAAPGETSASFIAISNGKSQLQRALDELEAASKAGRRVSPVTLTIGGNDMLAVRGKSTQEREAALSRFEANLGRILDELKARAGGADLIVTGYYNPYVFDTGGSELETGWVQRFNAVIGKQAESRGARLADFYAPLTAPDLARSLTWIASGDVHPNSNGHTLLAQAVWKASGYDRQAPQLVISYSPLASGQKVSGQERLAFKLQAADEWGTALALAAIDPDLPGAGSLHNAYLVIDNQSRTRLAPVPVRFSRAPSGAYEYSCLVDTTALAGGRHTLRFEVSDAAGNSGSIEFSFELA